MTKLKSKSAATKRFTISKGGKLMRRSQNSRHLRANKSTTQKRRMAEPMTIYKVFAKKIKSMMG